MKQTTMIGILMVTLLAIGFVAASEQFHQWIGGVLWLGFMGLGTVISIGITSLIEKYGE